MRLVDVVATSRRVAETASRRAKVGELATCLRGLAAEEIEIGVAFLAGDTRQGRHGVGYAMIREAHPATVSESPTLTRTAVDETLERIAATTGRGSAAERTQLLSGLFTRATREEQDFLVRLLLGELRQGALERIVIEGVALAASLPVADVRRAAMVAGGIASIARVALTEGAAGLTQYSIALFQPVAPML